MWYKRFFAIWPLMRVDHLTLPGEKLNDEHVQAFYQHVSMCISIDSYSRLPVILTADLPMNITCI